MPCLSAERGADPCVLPAARVAAGHVPQLPVCSPSVRTAEALERQAGLPARPSSPTTKIAGMVGAGG